MIRVLVVEDEPWIRKGIIKSICWDRLGMELAGEAENGEQALETLRDRPADLIVMDMRMPRLNGIELLKELKAVSFQGEIVVLSEFSDYAYMRQAIYANVFEYLLKPVDEAEFNATLERAGERIRARSSETQNQAGGPSDTAFEKACNDLLLADPSANRAGVQKLKELGRETEWQSYCAAAMLFWRRRAPGALSEPVGGETVASMLSDLRLEFEGKHDVLVFRDDRRSDGFSFVLGSNEPALVRGQLAGIASFVQGKYGVCARIGVGSWQQGCEEISLSYREACKAMRFQSRRADGIVRILDVEDDGGAEFICPIDDKKLPSMLQSAGKQAVLKLCGMAFEEARNREFCRISGLRALALDMVHIIERYGQRQGCGDVIRSLRRENLIDALEELNSVDEIEEFALYIAERLLDAGARRNVMQGHDIIDDIKKFIQTNYAEEIDLIHLAQEYHINYIHLSRLFKNRTGENFTDYLARVRMEKARELIKKGGLKIKEVAELVGYSNPYYFSSSYKKFFGHTPGETEDR